MSIGVPTGTTNEPATRVKIKHQILSDGSTVWVNASDGSCIGRFSRFGIDVHRTGTEQREGASECLDCTHQRPSLSEWRRFQDGMSSFHSAEVNDSHMPAFIKRLT